MEQLTRAMGLSRSSLYAAWGEKDALYLEALSHYVAAQGGLMRTMLERADSPVAAIAAILGAVVEETLADREAGCLAVSATAELAHHHPGVASIVARNMESNRRAFADAIRRGQSRGEIGAGKDAEALALFLVNAIHGLRVTGKVTADPATLRAIVDVTLAALN